MFCTICGKENKESAKYCRNCGNKLEELAICLRCGAAMDADDLFCERCGYKRGDALEVKPIVEEKIVLEYPRFESETPYEYGEEKPIIEEYDVPFSNKTIEDYLLDDYPEIPEANNPFETKSRNETFSEIGKEYSSKEEKSIFEDNKFNIEDNNYNIEEDDYFPKEKKQEKETKVKEEKQIEREEKITNGKFINFFLLLSSVVIIIMMFLPFFSSRGNGEYIRTSFANIRENHLMNYFTFVKFIFNNPANIISSKIDKFQYLFLVIMMSIIFVSMVKIIFFSIKNLKQKKYNKKYDIPFVVSLVSVFIIYISCNINSLPVYIILFLCLAVLIHKYFYEEKFSLFDFIKTSLLLSILVFFLISYRNIAIISEYSGYTTWSKFSIGRYFSGLSPVLVLGEGKTYIMDLISFLGWATSISFGVGLLLAIVVLIKIMRAMYSDEPSQMPIVSMAVSVFAIIIASIFSVFAKNNFMKYKSDEIIAMKYNGWLVISILCGIVLCLIFGFMNYKLNKKINKQKQNELKK